MDQQALKDFGRSVQRLIEGRDLTREETYAMFRQVLDDSQPDLQQGAFLAALVAKGETAEEIAAAWQAIDELDTVHTTASWAAPLFENSGTGMDSLKTFNVSTAAAVVAAACGVTMARHGARALSSLCGTVDLLEAVGVDVECEVPLVEQSIREAGIGLFNGMSPQVHPRALGRILSQIRFGSTLNVAASLANPARPSHGLRGVYSASLLPLAARVMQEIGYERGMVVHGTDAATGLGMDEISPCGVTQVVEFGPDGTREYSLTPEDLGVQRVESREIAATGDLGFEAVRFARVLAGDNHEACATFTCLNAGAILYVAGEVCCLSDGVQAARAAIDEGRSLAKMQQWLTVQTADAEAGLRRWDSLLN
jgi:anthranilate phosphoribosyltransferase